MSPCSKNPPIGGSIFFNFFSPYGQAPGAVIGGEKSKLLAYEEVRIADFS